MSLYDQLGGFAAVRSLVTEFYDRILDENSLAPFFADTDMAALVDHQTKFWATVLGGPASYTPEQLGRIHANMGIGNDHFDLVLEIAAGTLEDHAIDEETIGTVAERFEAFRSVIVQEAD